MFRKSVIVPAILGGFLLVGVAVPSQARDNGCEARVHQAERNLEKAVKKHGERSHQAEQQRRKLEQEREQCRVDHRGNDHHDSDRDHR